MGESKNSAADVKAKKEMWGSVTGVKSITTNRYLTDILSIEMN